MKEQFYALPEDFLSDISFCNYCKGAPEKDVRYWTNWFKTHPEMAHIFREAEQLYKMIGVYDEGYQQAFGRFSNEIHTTIQPKRRPLNVRSVVAAATVLALVSVSLYYIMRPAGTTAIAQTSGPLYDTIDAGIGQVRSILLADSTTVVLNSQSRLLVPKDYNKHERKIVLAEGEAFFDVTHHANHPFTVKSKGVETRVLGTSFNIQAYTEKEGMRITLLTGSVSVHTGIAPQPILLKPDEQLTITADRTYAVQKVSAARYSKWINGELNFYEESLQDIAAILSSRYDVSFVFTDNRCRKELFTASFDKNVPLKKVLELLSISRNIHFVQKGDTVLINMR
ncbi:FecR domain-containing protein [Chitinophaga sp. OAE865]|uniref:FecR family protein n=1 Tax=Chitinophaga sp. OAE865 TaxID=2817898 RepID=UPI001AE4B99A